MSKGEMKERGVEKEGEEEEEKDGCERTAGVISLPALEAGVTTG